jgi:hypothetical protein
MDFYGDMPMPPVHERVKAMMKSVDGRPLKMKQTELYTIAMDVAAETPSCSMMGYYEFGHDKKELEKFSRYVV